MDVDAFISSLSPRIERSQEGFWASRTIETVSYPDSGHDACASVELTSYWFTHRNACILSVARRFAPAGPVLDVGGGNGIVSLAMKTAGLPCVVLEPGAQGARLAHERGLPVIQATLSDAGIAEGAVPAAGLFDVLEHIEDDRGTLNALHRVIKPGGWLYLTVPAYRWLWSNEDVGAGHARRYDLGSIGERLAETGFDVAYGTYMFAPLVLPILALRSLPSLFGRVGGLRRPVAADHALPPGAVGRAIARMLDWERRRIAGGGTVPFGSSVLVAARKSSNAL